MPVAGDPLEAGVEQFGRLAQVPVQQQGTGNPHHGGMHVSCPLAHRNSWFRDIYLTELAHSLGRWEPGLCKNGRYGGHGPERAGTGGLGLVLGVLGQPVGAMRAVCG